MNDTPGQFFIGCSTDSGFVGPTCAMLSSIDDLGDVADATVMVADFGLTPSDRLMLRESAGKLGKGMQFVAIPRGSDKILAMPSWEFPYPLMGRLVLPREAYPKGARLLLLDSDMVVNVPLRPLMTLDLAGHPIAAVEDYFAIRYLGRRNYFNAGLLLIDLDAFNARDLAAVAMRAMAGLPQRPDFIEQDVLNEVIENDWLRLDRRWNYFHAGDDRGFGLEDFQSAFVIHYAGHKPWERPDHTAACVYESHVAASRRKIDRAIEPINSRSVDRDFLATCYEAFLGRELENEKVMRDRLHLPASEAITSIVASPEFYDNVLDSLRAGRPLPEGKFPGRPSLRQRYWAADRLGISAGAIAAVETADTWEKFLIALLSDERFAILAGTTVWREMSKPPRVALDT